MSKRKMKVTVSTDIVKQTCGKADVWIKAEYNPYHDTIRVSLEDLAKLEEELAHQKKLKKQKRA